MLIRVTEAGRPAFQLRKGEPAISVFDEDAVESPLSDDEVLAAFRPESGIMRVSVAEIQQVGLALVRVRGAEHLPLRLHEAHTEIHPNPVMTRAEFKRALKELES
jgi:hypothetical protein